jgi:hypothetical protein
MSIKQLLAEYKKWLENAYSSIANFSSRAWCTLGHKKALNQEEFLKYFDRKELNDEYVRRIKEESINKKQPYLYLQAEINFIYGMHKSFVARHKTRMQHYRDDCAQKHYHTRSAIEMGEGKFYAERDLAEKKQDGDK